MAVEFSEATFKSEVLESDKPVLVDFWAPWCGPCKMLAPVIDKLAAELGDQVVVGKVNVEPARRWASNQSPSCVSSSPATSEQSHPVTRRRRPMFHRAPSALSNPATHR
jgi:thioredoxin